MDRILPVVTSLLITVLFAVVLFWRERYIRRKSSSPPEHWSTTEGKVFVSRIREVEDGEGRIDYTPDVRCVYLVDNVSYTTTPSCSRSWFVFTREKTEKIVREYPDGMSVTVRYDPRDPLNAVVEEGQPRPTWE